MGDFCSFLFYVNACLSDSTRAGSSLELTHTLVTRLNQVSCSKYWPAGGWTRTSFWKKDGSKEELFMIFFSKSVSLYKNPQCNLEGMGVDIFLMKFHMKGSL